MRDDAIHLLVSFDEAYIPPFETMLTSIVMNDPLSCFHVWLLHGGLPQAALARVGRICGALGVGLTPVAVDRALFADAPVTKRYPQAMYYRLLAPVLLPKTLARVLYIDPDVLVINPLRRLWAMDMGGAAFAAAAHSCAPDVMNDVNRLRLYTRHDYFNTGVLLMDLDRARALVQPEAIFGYVQAHALELMLPDQDVFNALYGAHTAAIDDRVWNYDARNYHTYHIKSGGLCDMDWVMQNTAILHFCGRQKPWKKRGAQRFAALYKHYMQVTKRMCPDIERGCQAKKPNRIRKN